MFDVLDSLIDCLLSFYYEINNRWRNEDCFQPVNLRKKVVSDIQSDADIWDMIRHFRQFMSIQQLDILQGVSGLQEESNRVYIRIKQLNSIEYKIYRYCNGELNGKVPINKCLNDLFGVRIIIDDVFSHDEVLAHVEANFPRLKITNASKNSYVASHIYIMPDNQLFPWELQIWKKTDEKNNLASHKIYKQGYTTWETKFNNN